MSCKFTVFFLFFISQFVTSKRYPRFVEFMGDEKIYLSEIEPGGDSCNIRISYIEQLIPEESKYCKPLKKIEYLHPEKKLLNTTEYFRYQVGLATENKSTDTDYLDRFFPKPKLCTNKFEYIKLIFLNLFKEVRCIFIIKNLLLEEDSDKWDQLIKSFPNSTEVIKFSLIGFLDYIHILYTIQDKTLIISQKDFLIKREEYFEEFTEPPYIRVVGKLKNLLSKIKLQNLPFYGTIIEIFSNSIKNLFIGIIDIISNLFKSVSISKLYDQVVNISNNLLMYVIILCILAYYIIWKNSKDLKDQDLNNTLKFQDNFNQESLSNIKVQASSISNTKFSKNLTRISYFVITVLLIYIIKKLMKSKKS
jgi:hypothetical protein